MTQARPPGGWMPALRDFLGSPCPRCRRDILQAAPSSNRMPGEERAWCPRCDTRFSVDDLSRRKSGATGLIRRIFGGGSSPQ